MNRALPYFIAVIILFFLTKAAARRARNIDKNLTVKAGPNLAVAFLIVFWLYPVIFAGLTSRAPRGLPPLFSGLCRISCLFTHSVATWSAYYIQTWNEDKRQWVTLSNDVFFKMSPFGYVSRLYFLLDWSLGKYGERRRAEAASWIRERYAEIYPESPKPAAIRFLRGLVSIREREKGEGRWVNPLISQYPKNYISVLSEHVFDQSRGPGAPIPAPSKNLDYCPSPEIKQ